MNERNGAYQKPLRPLKNYVNVFYKNGQHQWAIYFLWLSSATKKKKQQQSAKTQCKRK